MLLVLVAMWLLGGALLGGCALALFYFLSTVLA